MKLSEQSRKYRETLLDQYYTRAKGILHLGAHLGQESSKYQQFNKPVVWVEAIPAVCSELTKKLSAFPNQHAFCALLDKVDGLQRTFKISNNMGGVSSSMFDFGDFGNGQRALWPDEDLRMVSELTLPTICLDTLLCANSICSAQFDFWIVDLQGAELLALQGAEKSLATCNAILVEVSEVEVYKGGVLWNELQQWLRDKGFFPMWLPEIPHDDVLFVNERIYHRVEADFRSDHYLRHNSRRLEHLATLGLPLENRSVLEVGAGIGDHTTFYLDRGCHVTVTEVRPENLEILKKRFLGNPNVEVMYLDMNAPRLPANSTFDVIHCYGLLYHLANPEEAIKFMAKHCNLLCLETCISPNDEWGINQVSEPANVFNQSFYGMGCRPDRHWVQQTLSKYFGIAYMTETQPCHQEFYKDQTDNSLVNKLLRKVFVAKHEIL